MIYLKIKKHFRGTNSRSLVLTHKPNYENNTCQLCQYMFTFINFFGLLKCPATILLFVENNEWSLLHENSVVNTLSKIPREMVSNSSYLCFCCMTNYANAFICSWTVTKNHPKFDTNIFRSLSKDRISKVIWTLLAIKKTSSENTTVYIENVPLAKYRIYRVIL